MGAKSLAWCQGHGRDALCAKRARPEHLVSLAPRFAGSLADALQTCRLPCDERFFLGDRPPFELALAGDGVFDRVELLGIDDPNWSSDRRVPRAVTLVVCAFAGTKIVGVADVQRAVSTTGDIHPSHWTTMSSSRGAAQDPDWAWGRGPFDSPLCGSLRAFDMRRREPSRGRRGGPTKKSSARPTQPARVEWPAMSEDRRSRPESNGLP